MISDEQLIAWEAELVEQKRFQWHGEVKALIDEIWRLKTAYENEVIKSVNLEREADWLAATLHLKGYVPEGTVIDWTKEGVRKAWREAARKGDK